MKKDISNILYILLMAMVFGLSSAFGQCPNGTYVNIVINPDQYPEETSWSVIGIYGDTIAEGGPYTNIIDYSPQTTQICILNGTYTFEIYDQYGDGMNGALWGGQDGSFYVMHCGDTLVEPDSANFGFASYHGFTLNDCAPPPPIFGCMDSSYVEFLPIATIDTGMCFTPKVFGCTDTNAYNFDFTANTNILTDSCTHTLELTDLAGNGWAGSYLEVSQGSNFLGFFTLDNGFDTTFTFEISITEPVEVKFNITQQSQFTSVQCGYSLYSEEHIAIDAPGGFANPLAPFVTVSGMPYCGNDCIEKIYGCTYPTAINYDSLANTDDVSCYYDPGCTSPQYLEYYTQGYTADYDDGTCSTVAEWGCIDSTAFNYDLIANIDNGGCIPKIFGCMQPLAFNYNVNANTEDTCIAIVYGCMSQLAINYDSLANTDDGSCIGIVLGCTDTLAFNWNPNANVDDSSCVSIIYGCINPTQFNYNPAANTNDGSCIPFIYGCTDSTMFNFNPLANADNTSCIPFIYGCTDPSALNYTPQANSEDFSCIDYIYGCTDSNALNYDVLANTDNGSCVVVVEGCMDQYAYNYNITANVNDSASCLYSANCITGPGNPYWLNDLCYEWVIDVDSYCCDNDWDEICQLTYEYCESTWISPEPPLRIANKKELIMITDLLGRPVNKTNNTFLLYIYNDGSVIKTITINK
mgnify:FL=1